jgi:membrane associated rhomboid family serine protease
VAEAETGPELSIVCKSCGSEVSPYVTECPYCGTRLRKRAPKLERVAGEVRVREGRKERRRRKAAERRARLADRAEAATSVDLAVRPLVTIAVLAASAILLVVERASGLSAFDLGAIVGSVDDEWWRYFAAPFVYDDLGYFFVCSLAIAIFLPGVERRVGTVGAALLVIGCGALGMLAADGLDSSLGDGIVVAAGGNGIALGVLAAWVVIRDAERRADPTEDYDRIAVAVAAAVLLLLPAIPDDFANVWAGLVGGLVGASCGLAAALGRRPTRG